MEPFLSQDRPQTCTNRELDEENESNVCDIRQKYVFITRDCKPVLGRSQRCIRVDQPDALRGCDISNQAPSFQHGLAVQWYSSEEVVWLFLPNPN